MRTSEHEWKERASERLYKSSISFGVVDLSTVDGRVYVSLNDALFLFVTVCDCVCVCECVWQSQCWMVFVVAWRQTVLGQRHDLTIEYVLLSP